MKTELIKLDKTAQDSDRIRYAAKLVEAGKLVAFPTETVYGIAAKVEAGVIGRLDQIKDRDSVKHYSLHVSSPWDISKYVPDMPMRAVKLVNKALPGPLTVVFDIAEEQKAEITDWLSAGTYELLYKGDSIGIRCPDNAVAREFLGNINAPVVAPSANPSGLPPATNSEMAMEMLDGKIDAILDAGPCREKLSSTVVKIGNKNLQVLREGGISEDEIKSMSTISIVFVCTGNTCRSPMAEAFFKNCLSQKVGCNVDQLEDFGYKISSAGVMAAIDQPATNEAVLACAEHDVDIRDHRSSGLSESQIHDSDIIFVMSRSHRQRILEFYPEVEDKCRLLAGWDEISDPFGGDLNIYRKCASQIMEAIIERLGEFAL